MSKKLPFTHSAGPSIIQNRPKHVALNSMHSQRVIIYASKHITDVTERGHRQCEAHVWPVKWPVRWSGLHTWNDSLTCTFCSKPSCKMQRQSNPQLICLNHCQHRCNNSGTLNYLCSIRPSVDETDAHANTQTQRERDVCVLLFCRMKEVAMEGFGTGIAWWFVR